MKPSAELIQLVEKSRSKVISGPENARLEVLLKDEQALDYYLDMASLEAGLTILGEEATGRPRNIVPFVQKYAAPLLAAVATVMFMFGFWSGKIGEAETSAGSLVTNDDPAAKSGSLAKISSIVGVEWDGDPTDLLLEQGSRPIKFKSGLVEVTFRSGVRALVEGPAEIQVTGVNQAYLTSGRLVADVPKGAEGFTVDHAQGKLIDLGTEFAMNVQDEAPVEVGVYRGEVEVYNGPDGEAFKIIENHAVQHGFSIDEGIKSVPFERDNYVRRLPSSEFAWKFPDVAPNEVVTKEFDVSHLVWKAGEYRAIIKWMDGRDGVSINRVDLYCDGVMVAEDVHRGSTGLKEFTSNNVYSLTLDDEDVRKGDWTLKLQMQVILDEQLGASGVPADSIGLVLFEGDSKIRAKDEDFIGTWEYRHDGDIHRREFHSDQTATYYLNGERFPDFDGSTWHLEDNILILKLPVNEGLGRTEEILERHLMRDHKELIFETLPYRNGQRVE